MEYMRVIVDYDDYTNTYYYQNFKIVDKKPKVQEEFEYSKRITKVERLKLDCENRDDEVFDYDYYKITIESINFENEIEVEEDYVCFNWKEEEDLMGECEE